MSRLWEALDLIRSGEMCKYIREDGEGNHCALGFIERAHGYDYYHNPVSWLGTNPVIRDANMLGCVVLQLFPELFRRDDWVADIDAWRVVSWWNNEPETTKADLELAFEKAAIRADELEGVM